MSADSNEPSPGARPGATLPRPVPTPVTVPPPNAVLIVLTNVPDEETARNIAEVLLQERLAACVNILAPCSSIYRWQGQIETASEIPLLIKTAQDRYATLQSRLDELHPYGVPEIVAWRPDAVLPQYFDWVIGETRVRRRPG